MNALDSPLLEALAFDYASFGLSTAVNNVWTWVAVITAAVSVWRFRASSSPPRRNSCPDETKPSPILISTVVSSSTLAAEPATAEAGTVEEAARPATAAAPPSSSPPCVFNGDGRTSGKFTFYYDQMEEEEEEEEEDRGDDGNGEVDGGDGNAGCELEWCGEGWEVMMRMRVGVQMGWFHRYQDLTVLDGSVVRLWDDSRRRNGSSSGAPLI